MILDHFKFLSVVPWEDVDSKYTTILHTSISEWFFGIMTMKREMNYILITL